MPPEEEKKAEEAKESQAMRQLGGTHAAVLAGVMALFGTGGMFSYKDLSAQMQAQAAQLNTMNITLAKIESREAVFQESINVAKVIADRHEERIRNLENQAIQREGRLLALEKLMEKSPR